MRRNATCGAARPSSERTRRASSASRPDEPEAAPGALDHNDRVRVVALDRADQARGRVDFPDEAHVLVAEPEEVAVQRNLNVRAPPTDGPNLAGAPPGNAVVAISDLVVAPRHEVRA